MKNLLGLVLAVGLFATTNIYASKETPEKAHRICVKPGSEGTDKDEIKKVKFTDGITKREFRVACRNAGGVVKTHSHNKSHKEGDGHKH